MKMFITALFLIFLSLTTQVQAITTDALLQEPIVININEASMEQLEELKGVGKKKAQAIIDYRNNVGLFTSVEQLLDIKGVGQEVITDNVGRLAI